jgi:hypothetical protein
VSAGGEAGARFAFVQFDFSGPLPLAEGRYVVRDATGEVERILVVADAKAPAHVPRRSPRRRRPRGADPAVPGVAVARLTVIEAEPLGGNEARQWMRSLRDESAAEQVVRAALGVVNRALHAAALTARDPQPRELGIGAALGVRAGLGPGDEVAEGHWSEALDLPAAAVRRRRRADALHADERCAAILGGRETPEPAETLLLRARADLDAGRVREFALQLEAGVEAMATGLDEGVDALRERVRAGAAAARAGEVDAATLDELTEALAACERLLRRRLAGRT